VPRPVVPEILAAQLRHQCRIKLLDAHAVGHLNLDRQLDAAVPADQGDVRFLLASIMRLALDGIGFLLARLEVVDGMHARKARMAELSDAFIALPGGLGTLEELFEVWTWGQLGYHGKPLGLLEVNGFYSKLTAFLDHIVGEGFVRAPHRDMLQVSESPQTLLDALDNWKPTVTPKWVDQKPG